MRAPIRLFEQAIDAAVQTYRNMGAEVVEVALPHLDYAIAAYYVIATAEASSNLARYDGVHYGHRTADPADYIEVYSQVAARRHSARKSNAGSCWGPTRFRAATTTPTTSRP